MMVRSFIAALAIAFTSATANSAVAVQTPAADAETARWLVHKADWGFLTTLHAPTGLLPSAEVLSFADGEPDHSLGRLFFYIMDVTQFDGRNAALTISEASLDATCGNRDAEDPRCARITLSGVMTEAFGKDATLGKQALFSRHPQMKTWPKSHGFHVFELKLDDIWMLDWYGGGVIVSVTSFLAAKPKHNFPPVRSDIALGKIMKLQPPPWNRTAARARWLVYHSAWGSIGTISVRLGGAPWGNVRSVADGVGKNSTGLVVLYVPSVDPSGHDIANNSHATISLSEAALSERRTAKGICGGKDPEDPTCARITLSGRLRALSSPAEIAHAQFNLHAHHPHAPWLATLTKDLYTIEIESIQFLDFFGGPAELSVAEYLAVEFEDHTLEDPHLVEAAFHI